jgi:hypothetical protein
MNAIKNEQTGTWHLIGTRGCGANPGGERIEGPWAEIRSRVARDTGTRCRNCSWPPVS